MIDLALSRIRARDRRAHFYGSLAGAAAVGLPFLLVRLVGGL